RRLVVVDGAEALATRDRFANLLMQYDTDRRVNRIFLFLAAAAQNHRCDPDCFTIDPVDIPGTSAGNISRVLGARQAPGVVDDAAISTLQRDHLAELLHRFSGRDKFGSNLFPSFYRFSGAAKVEHPSRQFEAERTQILRTLP